MEVVLGYLLQEMRTSRRVMADYRASRWVRRVFKEGIVRREVWLAEVRSER